MKWTLQMLEYVFFITHPEHTLFQQAMLIDLYISRHNQTRQLQCRIVIYAFFSNLKVVFQDIEHAWFRHLINSRLTFA